MGLCFKIFNCYCKAIGAGAIVLLAILLAPGILQNISFEYYEVDPEIILKPNSILNNAKVLVAGGLEGPESLAIKGKDELYTGDNTGKILKYKNGKLSTVVQLGFPCDQLDKKVCSYPLGMRFDNTGKLVVADMYGGILRINVDTGSVETLVSRFDPIDGKYPGLTEDISIARDGSIYWTDGTTVVSPENMGYSMLGHPKGRLLKYDPAANKSEVLVEDISFSNGVQLSDDEEFVIVSDFMKMRILRHYLKGKKKGTTDVFTTGLPGYPDNIRSNGKGGFYVGIPALRPKPYDIGKYPIARKLHAKTLYLAKLLNRYIYDLYPNVYLKQVDDVINILGLIPPFISTKTDGFIVELSNKGEIVGSLQSTNGKLDMLSQITVGAQHAYIVSPRHDKIWQIELNDLHQ